MRKAKRITLKLPEDTRQEHDLLLLEIIAEIIVQISVPESGIRKTFNHNELK
ncbi:hypothetical protein HDC92_002020 [Pedobacter sp. AK017]|nr:hypothetical protein [Pedobacter sp. AK017]